MALSAKQSEKLGEKLLDLANISIGGLVIGSMLSEKGFQLPLFIIGILLWIFFTLLGLRVLKEGDRECGRQ